MGVVVEGFLAPEFEQVAQMFEASYETASDDQWDYKERAQLCVFIGDTLVIDLFAKPDSYDTYNSDTLQCMFSSSNCALSLVVAVLVDRGLLDYDERITAYWPEFEENGKGDVTLADVLRHESKLPFLDKCMEQSDFLRSNLKANSVGRYIEALAPHWSSNVDWRYYHSVTRGLILNEVVRRVDPKSRTIGEVFYEEVASYGIFCGLPESSVHMLAPQVEKPWSWILQMSMIPSFIDSTVGFNVLDFLYNKIFMQENVRNDVQMIERCLDPKKLTPEEELVLKEEKSQYGVFRRFFSDTIRRGEIPSINFHGSARGMARVAATLANKGVHPSGGAIISQQTWEKMHSGDKLAYDVAYGIRTSFTKGGVNHFVPLEYPNKDEVVHNMRSGWYGWFGFGGSVMQWHPELEIGFAYISTSLRTYDKAAKIGAKLQQAVVECQKMKLASSVPQSPLPPAMTALPDIKMNGSHDEVGARNKVQVDMHKEQDIDAAVKADKKKPAVPTKFSTLATVAEPKSPFTEQIYENVPKPVSAPVAGEPKLSPFSTFKPLGATYSDSKDELVQHSFLNKDSSMDKYQSLTIAEKDSLLPMRTEIKKSIEDITREARSPEVPTDAAYYRVGDRVQDLIDYHRATVMFVGKVPPTSGEWLGVDWDAGNLRGKHDGCHDGKRYFTAKSAKSGSFVRPNKIRLITVEDELRFTAIDEMPPARVLSEDSLDRVGRSSTLGRSNESILSDDRKSKTSFSRGSKSQESLLSDARTSDAGGDAVSRGKSVEFLDDVDDDAGGSRAGSQDDLDGKKDVKRSNSKKGKGKFGSLKKLTRRNKSIDNLGTM